MNSFEHLIIIMKVSYIVLHDLFTNCLFNNTMNIIIDKFNELFFYFSFFKNIIL